MAGIRIQGMTQVLTNLNRELDRIKYASLSGLIKYAINVRRDMDKIPPLIPVDLGNLRSSFYIVTKLGVKQGGGSHFNGENSAELSGDHAAAIAEAQGIAQSIFNPTVVMGFSANYALWVHENVDPGTIWSRPGSGAKFFESALKKNVPNFIGTVGGEIIASEYLASKGRKL